MLAFLDRRECSMLSIRFSRLSVLVVIAVLAMPASCAPSGDKSVPKALVNATHVAVVVLTAAGPDRTAFPTPPRSNGDDIRVRSDVESAVRKWGRYTITIDPKVADLIVAVRPGRRASVTVGGRGRIGTDGVGYGPVAAGEVGPSRDLMEVYQGPEGSMLLWRGTEDGGFDLPDLPLVQKFKRDVEAAAKKKP
jgi:hypothetical protein